MMLCKFKKSSRFDVVMIAIGIITLIFGVVSHKGLPEDAHNLNMLMGMFSGLGGALTAIGIVKLIHYKRTPAEKLKKEEIELTDERNVQILRAAYTIASTTATILFAVLAFIFVWLDYKVPAFISIGALYVQQLAFFIAYKHFSRKM